MLDDNGYAVVTCPDLKSVAKYVAADKLTDVLYHSPAGPISQLIFYLVTEPQLQKAMSTCRTRVVLRQNVKTRISKVGFQKSYVTYGTL